MFVDGRGACRSKLNFASALSAPYLTSHWLKQIIGVRYYTAQIIEDTKTNFPNGTDWERDGESRSGKQFTIEEDSIFTSMVLQLKYESRTPRSLPKRQILSYFQSLNFFQYVSNLVP